jgi:hypothetical protein
VSAMPAHGKIRHAAWIHLLTTRSVREHMQVMGTSEHALLGSWRSEVPVSRGFDCDREALCALARP